jgi:ribosomal protein S15
MDCSANLMHSIGSTAFLPSPHLVFIRGASKSARKSKASKRGDAYSKAQKKAHELAKLSRQRDNSNCATSDPVRGKLTPFVQAFDSPKDGAHSVPLNYGLSEEKLSDLLEKSRELSLLPSEEALKVPDVMSAYLETHEEEHLRAKAAMERIAKLDQGGAQDRNRYNIRKCIATFGRHNTDRERPAEDVVAHKSSPALRAGPDTGSSEVQIAILTAKIRAIADAVDGRGRKDKSNKRILRLLVHKRQKLLRYLRRKERGGWRWQRTVNSLGLTDATWKGEITL